LGGNPSFTAFKQKVKEGKKREKEQEKNEKKGSTTPKDWT